MLSSDKTSKLIEDLSSRVPYGVKCIIVPWEGYDPNDIRGIVKTLYSVSIDGVVTFIDDEEEYYLSHGDIIPVLYSIDGLNSDEKDEYVKIQAKVLYNSRGLIEEDFSGYVRYCNERHLDWRGMLKAGIAEDATGKGVY